MPYFPGAIMIGLKSRQNLMDWILELSIMNYHSITKNKKKSIRKNAPDLNK